MAVAGALMQWLKLPAWKVGGRGFKPRSGIQVSKKQKVSSLLTHKDSSVESLRDREVVSSASDRQNPVSAIISSFPRGSPGPV